MRIALVAPEGIILRPLEEMNRDAVSLFGLVYESLIVLDDNREPQPSLAEKWDVLADGKTWLFTIRDGVYFHDGREMTAYDVVATMDAIRAIASESGRADNAKGLYCLLPESFSSWTADDERTLRLRTERPYYAVLYALTFPILQAQSVGMDNPPGTGPYRIDYFAPGETLWLEGNQNWWGRAPHISSIEALFFKSDDDALAAYDREDVDILMTRSTAAIRYRGTVTSRTNAYDYSTRQLEVLMYNNQVSKLKDVRMRQAICHAINKSRLLLSVYQGVATATDTLQAPGGWLYNDDTASYPVYGYNVERANQLLDEMGWNLIDDDGYRYKRGEDGTTTLSLRLFYYNEPGNTLRKEAAAEIAAMLKAVGIKTTTQAYSYENGAKKLSVNIRDYDLFLCAYNFDSVPDPSFILSTSNAGYGNFAGYRNSDMTALLKKLRAALDKDEFRQVWWEIQELLARDVPFWPLYWRSGVVLTRYAYSSIRDIREYELLRSLESYQ